MIGRFEGFHRARGAVVDQYYRRYGAFRIPLQLNRNRSYANFGFPLYSPQADDTPPFIPPQAGGNPSFSGETGVTHCVVLKKLFGVCCAVRYSFNTFSISAIKASISAVLISSVFCGNVGCSTEPVLLPSLNLRCCSNHCRISGGMTVCRHTRRVPTVS